MISAYSSTSWRRPARSFNGLPVMLGDVTLGRVRDVVLEEGLDRVVGFALEGRGGLALFLPWVAASPERDRISVGSVFALLSGPEVDFYLRNGIRLGDANDALRNAFVDASGAVGPVDPAGDTVTQTAERG